MKIQDNKLLLQVSNIAINSGIRIMEYYNNKIIVKEKEDKTPVTKADLDANDIILSELQKLEDRFPILSEESLVKWNERKIWQKYWLVDPLDGTKEFINKND